MNFSLQIRFTLFDDTNEHAVLFFDKIFVVLGLYNFFNRFSTTNGLIFHFIIYFLLCDCWGRNFRELYGLWTSQTSFGCSIVPFVVDESKFRFKNLNFDKRKKNLKIKC